MGNSAVKEHYATASKTGVFQLSNRLDKFPIKVLEITSLRSLDLSENKLTEVPEEIRNLVNLKHLKFNKNWLLFLPEAIGSLAKLESLSVCDNRLECVPTSLSQLSHLTKINLSGNSLTEFPNIFAQLQRLDLLDLSRNEINKVPDHVKDVHAVELILNQNQISFISEEVAKCPRLRTLRLEENCLSLAAVPVALLKDSMVAVLTLEGNLFEMKELANLDGYSDYMDRYTAVKKKMF